MVVEHIMTLSELIATSAPTLSFNSDGGIFKLFCEHFNARCDAYINAMKDMFRKIPQTIKIALTPKKVQKLNDCH